MFIVPAERLTDDIAIQTVLSQSKSLARPVISSFQVSALAIGESGTGYVGVNVEFAGHALSKTIHAEQFALALARQYGESALRHMYVTEMPCGHCRQFILELENPALPITVFSESGMPVTTTLADLLPHPFTLAQMSKNILTSGSIKNVSAGNTLMDKAYTAACRAYVPYTKTFCGVALQVQSGEVFSGSALESAAYNPTLSPLHDALIQLIASGKDYFDIKNAALAYAEGNLVAYQTDVEGLLATLVPGVLLQTEAFPVSTEG